MDYHAILEVKSLRKTYDSRLNVLNNIDFSIQKGEVVVIIGPSGCGKSTFLRCLNRLEDIQDGTLFLEGVAYEREKKNIYKIREKVGMVFQRKKGPISKTTIWGTKAKGSYHKGSSYAS